MGHSRCPRYLVCSSHLCCTDQNLFFQSAERLCWIEFCYHIKHRSKRSHHSLQVRETQLLLSSFSKHSWNELSHLFMESQQSTPGRCCLLSFFPPHVLSKDLSLLAACMYYDADLLRAIEKGYFGAGSLGRMNLKCTTLLKYIQETDVVGFAGSSKALYCSAICCIQILSLVWSLAQLVWDFHHCHKKSELTHPSLHLIWFLDCRHGLETLKQWNKTLCVYLNRPVPETNRTLSVNEIYLLDSGAQYKWVGEWCWTAIVLFPMTPAGSIHISLGKQVLSPQQIRAADRPCWGQRQDVKVVSKWVPSIPSVMGLV